MINDIWKWVKPIIWPLGEIRSLDIRLNTIEKHLDLDTSEGKAVEAFEQFTRKENK